MCASRLVGLAASWMTQCRRFLGTRDWTVSLYQAHWHNARNRTSHPKNSDAYVMAISVNMLPSSCCIASFYIRTNLAVLLRNCSVGRPSIWVLAPSTNLEGSILTHLVILLNILNVLNRPQLVVCFCAADISVVFSTSTRMRTLLRPGNSELCQEGKARVL